MLAGIIIVLFVVLLLLSVPIGSTLGIISIAPSLIDADFGISAEFIIRSMFGGIDSFALLAIPMFVLSGIIMARGGISKRLFDTFSYFLADKTAGIPCAVVVTCLFYGAISGSAPATVAAVGAMSMPVMLRLGYDKKFSTALVAVAGGLGVIIPPSIPYILYGSATGASVSKMFIAGVIPGFLVAGLLMGYCVYYCKKHGEDKEKIQVEVDSLKQRGFLSILKDGSWALLTPVIILGCIYSGVASPTEAAVISVFYALIISVFVYKTLKISEIKDVLVESLRTFTPILFILAAAVSFSRILTLLQVPQMSATFLTVNFSNKWIVLLLINILLLIVGMVMDTSPAILILAPILQPIMATYGMDTIQFGIIMVLNLAIGFVTPPIGVNLFIASRLTEVPVFTIAKKALPLIVLLMVALVLICIFPQISMILVA
ncbi:MAG: TRAP transporter large permease [Bacillota bacterium]|nr:TRAP transporter large permease [Bacillota bacterium]